MTHDIDGRQRETPITRLSDEDWAKVRPVLEANDPPRGLGRKRADPRRVLEAIIYRLHTGCPWNALPHEYLGPVLANVAQPATLRADQMAEQAMTVKSTLRSLAESAANDQMRHFSAPVSRSPAPTW